MFINMMSLNVNKHTDTKADEFVIKGCGPQRSLLQSTLYRHNIVQVSGRAKDMWQEQKGGRN